MPHRLQCSGSQDSFATDSYCGNIGGPNASSQWQLSNCADSICPHSAAQLVGAGCPSLPSTNLMQPTGTVLPLPPIPPMFTNGGGKFSNDSHLKQPFWKKKQLGNKIVHFDHCQCCTQNISKNPVELLHLNGYHIIVKSN